MREAYFLEVKILTRERDQAKVRAATFETALRRILEICADESYYDSEYGWDGVSAINDAEEVAITALGKAPEPVA